MNHLKDFCQSNPVRLLQDVGGAIAAIVAIAIGLYGIFAPADDRNFITSGSSGSSNPKYADWDPDWGSKAPHYLDQGVPVAIRIMEGEDVLSCTGVTMNPEWVLSAAHCFVKDRDMSSYTVFGAGQTGVSEIQLIPEADLALLRVKTPMPKIGCTTLPTQSPRVGDPAVIYGLRGERGEFTELPFKVSTAYHVASNNDVGTGEHEMLAFTPEKEPSREGDSGSGVFIKVGKKLVLTGILSGVSQSGDVMIAEDLSRWSAAITQVAGRCPTA